MEVEAGSFVMEAVEVVEVVEVVRASQNSFR